MIRKPYPIVYTKYDDDGTFISMIAYPLYYPIIIGVMLLLGVVFNSMFLSTPWLLVTLPVSFVLAIALNAAIFWIDIWIFSRTPEMKAAMAQMKTTK